MHTMPRWLRRRDSGCERVHGMRRRDVCSRAGRDNVLRLHRGQLLPRRHGRNPVPCGNVLPRRESDDPDAVHAGLVLRGGRGCCHGRVRCGQLLPARLFRGRDVPRRLLLHGRHCASVAVRGGLLRIDGQLRG